MTTRSRAGLAVFLLLAAGASTSWAQQASPADASLGKVEVTGTNIPRTDAETALPVQVITREQIERGGMITAQDLLERISANQSYGAWNDSLGVGSSLAGYTGASLRGLGSERTLVLLNGRRLAPYALSGGQSVDLSGIAASAIERVEVLKDGASAIYGTDAIGGVINFILRRDYQGVDAGVTYLGVQQGGGENARATLTAGWGSLAKDGLNAFVTLDHLRQEPLPARDREFSRTSYIPEAGLTGASPSAFPANIRQRGGFGSQNRNPTIPLTGATPASCLPPISFPTALAPLACGFDYAPLIDSIPESRKTNVIGRASWQASADHLLFAEASYYRGDFVYKISPTPAIPLDPFSNPFQLRPSSPYYPTAFVASLPRGNPNLPVQVNYRLAELGPRVNEPVVDQSRVVLGSQGVVSGWDYALTAGHTANKQVDQYASGIVSEARFRELFDTGAVNPFAPNTPEVVARMRATQYTGPISDNRASHTGAELKVSATPWTLASGDVAVAFGVEGRREKLQQTNSEILYSGDVLGGVGAAPSLEPTQRKVWSVLGETVIPLSRSLEANLALRHDHYSDFGGSTNPKLTLRWQPVRSAVLRASAGTGFRAPTLSDLFIPNTYSPFDGVVDPVRCPVTGAPEDCGEGIYRLKAGGNPDLQPETSRQLNAGIVLEPQKGLSLAVDYYRIRIDDLLTVVPLDAVLSDYARWAPTHVFRKPPDSAYPQLPGPIDYFLGTVVNAGSRSTSGIDLDVQLRLPARSWGRVTASFNGTYVIDYEASEFESVSPGTADLVTGTGAIARWRHYAALDWTHGAWGATLAQSFQLGHDEYDLRTRDPQTGIPSGFRRVGSYSVWDLTARYAGIPGLKTIVGVRNLFNRDPPQAYATSTFQRGSDPSYADPRGRMFYLSLTYAWR